MSTDQTDTCWVCDRPSGAPCWSCIAAVWSPPEPTPPTLFDDPDPEEGETS